MKFRTYYRLSIYLANVKRGKRLGSLGFSRLNFQRLGEDMNPSALLMYPRPAYTIKVS